MLIDMCLPKLDIYRGTIAPDCFNNQKALDALIFFQKKVFSDVRSEIHLVRWNIFSTWDWRLLSIHINDTFFALNEIDICNFADDKNLKSLLKR